MGLFPEANVICLVISWTVWHNTDPVTLTRDRRVALMHISKKALVEHRFVTKQPDTIVFSYLLSTLRLAVRLGATRV